MIKAKTLTYLILTASLALTGCASGTEKTALSEEGISYYEAGDYETALSYFSEALQASRGEVSDFTYDLLRYRAECELRTGDTEAARSSYEALLTLDGNGVNSRHYEEILSELDALSAIEEANELFSLGSYDEAAAIYKLYASLDQSAAGKTAWFNEAVCYEYMGDFDEAAYLLSLYLEAYPQDEEAQKESLFCESRK